MGKQVIVACDFDSEKKLCDFLDEMEKTEDKNLYFKIGMELITAGVINGFNPVKIIKDKGYKVFLDLKLKDIPNTIINTLKICIDSGVDMIDFHADGGYKMMKSVADYVNGIYEKYYIQSLAIKNFLLASPVNGEFRKAKEMELEQLQEKLASKPLLIADTVLTSMSDEELKEEINVRNNSKEQVASLALLAKKAGFNGVVCSALEVGRVKETCGRDFITITPGIRFNTYSKNDQSRVTTPTIANILGADYIVVGRPITQSSTVAMSYNRCKNDFTKRVKSKKELENAKEYIASLNKESNLSAEDVVAEKLISAGAFKINTEDPYLLKSGIASPLYCNCRDLYKHPEEQKIIMDYLAELVRQYYPEAEEIFGTPMSAISFGALVAERLNLPFGFVREEQKDHGLNTKIEGIVKPGIKAVQIEDLITSGASSLKPIQTLKEAGVDVLGVASIVNNNFVETKKLIAENIPYHSITTMSKIAHYAGKYGLINDEQYSKVKYYEQNPGDESWMSNQAWENICQKRSLRRD